MIRANTDLRTQGRTAKSPIMSIVIAIAALLLAAIPALGQQIGNPPAEQGVTFPRGTYVIRNARIVTLAGPDIENGTVVIRDGKIDAVGASVSVPSGAQSI